MCDLHKYKDLIGKPGEGIHSYRMFGIAIVDLAVTVGAAYLISDNNFWATLIIILIIMIYSHYIFGVDTAVNVALFGRHNIEEKNIT